MSLYVEFIDYENAFNRKDSDQKGSEVLTLFFYLKEKYKINCSVYVYVVEYYWAELDRALTTFYIGKTVLHTRLAASHARRAANCRAANPLLAAYTTPASVVYL